MSDDAPGPVWIHRAGTIKFPGEDLAVSGSAQSVFSRSLKGGLNDAPVRRQRSESAFFGLEIRFPAGHGGADTLSSFDAGMSRFLCTWQRSPDIIC